MGQQNYYDILEVPQEAPQHEIHEAFRRAKKTYSLESPALYSIFSKEEAQEFLKLIEEAFSVLGNQSLRKAYDEKLRISSSWGAPIDAVRPDSDSIPAIPVLSPVLDSGYGDSQPSSWDPPQPEVVGQAEPEPKPTPAPLEVVSEDPNTGSTAISTFRINNSIESEIFEQTVFDGGFLKMVREYKCIDVRQMSQFTRISSAYLEALEENDYANLPAPVFVRGFVVQYAKLLGLNQKTAASSYIKMMKESTRRKS